MRKQRFGRVLEPATGFDREDLPAFSCAAAHHESPRGRGRCQKQSGSRGGFGLQFEAVTFEHAGSWIHNLNLKRVTIPVRLADMKRCAKRLVGEKRPVVRSGLGAEVEVTAQCRSARLCRFWHRSARQR